MADQDILELAVREKRLVLTMDKDFGELVFLSGLSHSGVLLLRLEDADAAAKVLAVASIFSQHAARLEGAFSVYQSGHLRVRR